MLYFVHQQYHSYHSVVDFLAPQIHFLKSPWTTGSRCLHTSPPIGPTWWTPVAAESWIRSCYKLAEEKIGMMKILIYLWRLWIIWTYISQSIMITVSNRNYVYVYNVYVYAWLSRLLSSLFNCQSTIPYSTRSPHTPAPHHVPGIQRPRVDDSGPSRWSLLWGVFW